MRVALESLWSVFKKHLFSPTILMILCTSGVTLEPLWGHFELTFGIRGCVWATFGSLWNHFGITLGLLLAFEGDFGSLWDHSGSILGSLSASESDFGSLWGRFGTFRGHFDVILVPFWAHFWVTLGAFWGRFVHFGITLESLWIYKGCFRVTLVRFQKTLIFPQDLNDSVYLWGDLGANLGSL